MGYSYFGQLRRKHLQQFRKQRTINNELYIVNNMDVFGINDNGTTLEMYISSDWFAELGYAFLIITTLLS